MLARYLIKHAELELVFSAHGAYDKSIVHVNAEWAGGVRTKKSTIGGMVTVGILALNYGALCNAPWY